MDFDADGRQDILSGSWPGEIYLFLRQADGSFAAAQTLRDADDKALKVGSASAAVAHDWDGDGDLDLLVGVIEGHVYLIRNEGTRSQPVWGEPTRLRAGEQEISVPQGDAGPTVADWDGDGRADLIVGAGDGSVSLYRNVGSTSEPSLGAAETLVAASPRAQGDPPEGKRDPLSAGCGTRSKVCVSDFNGDGRLDLLLGDFNLHVEKRTDLTAEELEKGKAAQAKLQQLYGEYMKYMEQSDDGNYRVAEGKQAEFEAFSKQLEQASEEYRKYDPTRYEYHGWVWFFARQAPSAPAGQATN